jgi:ATP-dependent DNA ligase
MTRFTDQPQLVSADFLRRLDDDPPGTWMGSKKLDGYRRVADNTSGRWEYQAKHTSGPASKQMPVPLTQFFESLAWPANVVLDCEYIGMRCVANTHGQHSLHVFDILYYQRDWLGAMPFKKRYALLEHLFIKVMELAGFPQNAPVQFVPARKNPGLVAMYQEQFTDALSEGLVVRHADSTLVGSFTACAKGDRMYKVKYR